MCRNDLSLARGLLVAILAFSPFLSGCATRSTSTVSTTEVRSSPDASYRGMYREGPSTVEVTKTEETTKESGRHGFFGILFDIIALPFRALASIL